MGLFLLWVSPMATSENPVSKFACKTKFSLCRYAPAVQHAQRVHAPHAGRAARQRVVPRALPAELPGQGARVLPEGGGALALALTSGCQMSYTGILAVIMGCNSRVSDCLVHGHTSCHHGLSLPGVTLVTWIIPAVMNYIEPCFDAQDLTGQSYHCICLTDQSYHCIITRVSRANPARRCSRCTS
jgi:hypothetical protein